MSMGVKNPDAFVAGTLALVLRVSRISGIAPIRFVKQGGGWRITLLPRLYVYGYILVTVISLVTLTAVLNDFLLDPAYSIRMQNSMRRIVWVLDVGIMLSLICYGGASAPKYLKTMIACLNTLQKINNELNVPWSKKMETKKLILLVIWSLFTVILTVTDHFMVFNLMQVHQNNDWLLIPYLFYYFCYWIMQLWGYQFVLLTLHINQSFVALNEKLNTLCRGMLDAEKMPLTPIVQEVFTVNKMCKKSVNSTIDSLAFVSKVKSARIALSAPETVHRHAVTFVSLCNIVREVDQCHGPMLMLLLVSFLLHMTITPYYLVCNMSDFNHEKSSYFSIFLQGLWCVYHGGNLVMMIEPCHLTLIEISTTRAQISNMMRHTNSTTEPLAIELDLFYRHLILNKVSYSPLQITTLTRGLVATILGSIITYLVVIIQL